MPQLDALLGRLAYVPQPNKLVGHKDWLAGSIKPNFPLTDALGLVLALARLLKKHLHDRRTALHGKLGSCCVRRWQASELRMALEMLPGSLVKGGGRPPVVRLTRRVRGGQPF